MTTKKVSASDFKTHCLQYLKGSRHIQTEWIVTKRGRRVAKLVPIIKETEKFAFGDMKGTLTIKEDILKPIDAEWEVLDDNEIFG